MPEHFDALETRAPELREQALFAALSKQIAHCLLYTSEAADECCGV